MPSSLPRQDAAAISVDWVIPLLVVGAVMAGVALVATDTGLQGNLTVSDSDADEADAEAPLPGQAGSSGDGNASEASNASDAVEHEPVEEGDPNATVNASGEAAEEGNTTEGNLTAPLEGFDERWRGLDLQADLAGWTPESVVADPAGALVYIAGRGGAGQTTEGYENGTGLGIVLALDGDTGEIIWMRTTAGPRGEGSSFHGLAITPDGQRLVAAGSASEGNRSDMFALALASTTGEPVWNTTIPEEGGGFARASDLAVTPAGRYVALTGMGGTTAVLLDAEDGRLVWKNAASTLPGTSHFVGEAIATGPAGEHVFVAGRHVPAGPDGRPSIGTIAYTIPDGERAWLATAPGDNRGGRGFDVGVSPTGEAVAVAGVSSRPGSNQDATIVVYDPVTGEERWTQRLDGPRGGTDKARALTFATGGLQLYVTGEASVPDAKVDIATMAFHVSDGQRIWTRTYDGGAEDLDRGVDVTVDPLTHAIIATGASRGEPGGADADIATLAYAPRSGELLAEHRLDASETNTSWEGADGLALDADARRLVVLGDSGGQDGVGPLAVGLALEDATTDREETPSKDEPDAGEGYLRERWRTTAAPDGLERLRLVDAAAGPSGKSLIAAGSAGTEGHPEHPDGSLVALVHAYDVEDGEPRWTRTIDTDDPDTFLRAVHVSQEHGLVAASGETRSEDASRVVLVLLDARAGDLLWTRTFTPEGADRAGARDVALTPDGEQVVVTGTSGEDRLTVAFDASTGEPTWSSLVPAGDVAANAIGQALVGGPASERVYVTGQTTEADPDRPVLTTTAYHAATGEQRWSASWAQSTNATERAQAIALDPDGEHVAVAGTSSADGTDIVTVVYDADTGEETWARLHEGPSDGGYQARGVAFAPEGEAVLTAGITASRDIAANATLSAYAVDDGALQWSRAYDGGIGADDVTVDLAVDPHEATAYLLARSQGPPGEHADAATIAYDLPTGDRIGEARFDAGANGTERPTGLALAPDGSWVGLAGIADLDAYRPMAVLFDVHPDAG